MRFGVGVVTLAVVTLLALPYSALAVGYERVEMSGGKVKSKGDSRATLTESLKKAAFCEKYPAIIDGTALAIKDLLGQFGLADRKSR
jgi:hypothetical protein